MLALHGIEEAIQQAFITKEGKPSLIRYADDFVVLHPTRQGVERARQVIERWLQDIGLELKPSKTRITHTLEGEAGFDFLGFNVRQHRVGKTHSARNPGGVILGFKTIITPSKPAVKEHITALGQIVRKHQAAPQEALIGKLNPVIQGWANYHRVVVAQATFDLCDHHVYSMLRHWARHRHPKKRAKWVVQKYWTTHQEAHWVFKAPDGSMLKQHAKTPIKRHEKVQGMASPYDGNLI